MRALHMCYIKLCHKAELQYGLGATCPRHPYAPPLTLPQTPVDPHSAASPRTEQPTLCASNPSTTGTSGMRTSMPAATCSSIISNSLTDNTGEAQSQVQPGVDSTLQLSHRTPQHELQHAQHSQEQTATADTTAADPGSQSDSGHEHYRTQHATTEALHHSMPSQAFSLDQVQHCCFHSPFNKLVRKAFAQLQHIDELRREFRSQQQQEIAQPPTLVPQDGRLHSALTTCQPGSAADNPSGSSTVPAPSQMSCREQSGASLSTASQMGGDAGAGLLATSERSHVAEQAVAPDAMSDSPSGHSRHDLHHQQPQQMHLLQQPTQQQQQQRQQQQQQQWPPPHQQRADPSHQSTSQAEQHQQQQKELGWLLEELQRSNHDRKRQGEITDASLAGYKDKVEPSCQAGIQLGNLYAGT